MTGVAEHEEWPHPLPVDEFPAEHEVAAIDGDADSDACDGSAIRAIHTTQTTIGKRTGSAAFRSLHPPSRLDAERANLERIGVSCSLQRCRFVTHSC